MTDILVITVSCLLVVITAVALYEYYSVYRPRLKKAAADIESAVSSGSDIAAGAPKVATVACQPDKLADAVWPCSDERNAAVPPAQERITNSNQLLLLALSGADRAAYRSICERHGVAVKSSPAELARGIRRDAGSSVANLFRGDGVEYAEVVADVAKLLKAKDVDPSDVVGAEQAILTAVWNRYLESLSEEERRDLAKLMAAEAARVGRSRATEAIAKSLAVGVAARVVIAAMGRQLFLSLLWNVILPRLGLWTAARMLIAGPAAIAGPVGWALLGATALYEVDKPALRKVVPTVLDIAVLRGSL